MVVSVFMRKKCQEHDMKESIGIINGSSGRCDFHGNVLRGITMSVDPKIWCLVRVMKCKSCGHSERL